MFDLLFKNQVLMTSVIAFVWIAPGIFFVSLTNRKYKNREKIRQINRIKKLYPK